jgi:O-6-methylguanine DNA methyltransferase
MSSIMPRQNQRKSSIAKVTGSDSLFARKVHAVVSKIPLGKTMTYREVAIKAGFLNAFRAVGSLMAKNYDKEIPCHRVVKSDGTIGNYNRGGAEKKKQLLAYEQKLVAKHKR